MLNKAILTNLKAVSLQLIVVLLGLNYAIAKNNSCLDEVKSLYQQEEFNDAIVLASKCLKSKNEYPSNDYGHIHNYLGVLYAQKGKYLKSIFHFSQAYNCFTELKNDTQIARTSINLAGVYLFNEKYNTAKRYLKIAEKSTTLSEHSKADIQNGLSLIYESLHQNDSALFYLNQAQEFYKNNKDTIKNCLLIFRKVKIIHAPQKKLALIDSFLMLDCEQSKLNAHTIFYNLTQEAIQLKDSQLVETLWKKARSIKYDEPDIEIKNLEATTTAKYYEWNNQADSSLKYLKKHIEYKSQLDSQKLHNIANFKDALPILQEQQDELSELNSNLAKFAHRFWIAIVLIIIISILLSVAIYLALIVKKSQKKLKSLARKLSRESSYKEKMISILSHDIRTPLNHMESLFDLALFTDLNPNDFKTILKKIKIQTNNTKKMLDQVLNWIRLNNKEIKLQKSQFSSVDFCKNLKELYQPTAAEKDVELEFDITDHQIDTDPNLLDIIFRNLLSNAIKFTKPGGKVTFKYYKQDHKNIFIVSDTGIGIKPNDLYKIKKAILFSTTGTKNETGSGIGLSLVRECIKLLDAEFDVESTLGKGSSFKIIIS